MPLTAKIQEDSWHSQLDLRQDYVVNCVSAGGGGLEGYRTSYLEGMKSILKWAGLEHSANFVYTGSTSVYPQTDGQTVDEKSSTEGTSESGSILLETEELLMEYSPFKNAAILRLGGLYGPNRHYLLNMLREGITEIPGRGDLQLNLLHLEDAASAVFAARDNPLGNKNTMSQTATQSKNRNLLFGSLNNLAASLLASILNRNPNAVQSAEHPESSQAGKSTRQKSVHHWAGHLNFQTSSQAIGTCSKTIENFYLRWEPLNNSLRNNF